MLLMMPINLKNRGFINPLIVLILLLVAVTVASVAYLFKTTKENSVLRPLPTKSPAKVTSTPSSQVGPAASIKAKYALERKKGNNTEKLFAISNNYLLDILRWNNLLIFSDGGQNDNNYPPDIQIKVHDLDTGQTNVIFDSLEENKQFDNADKFPDTLSELKVINNTLYISLGGYLRDGAIYWLDLPLLEKPQKLIAVRNGSITKIRNWYFVAGGEGDSCWSERDFYLLDPKAKNTKKIVSSKSGCNEGEEYLGLTKDGKMIMAYHGNLGADSYQGDYEYIATLDIFNPGIKKIIVTREQMPPKINRMLYSEERDQLLMIGSEIYLYDFTEGKLNKVVNVPEGVKLYFNEKNWIQDKVCLDGEKGTAYNKYELDLSLKTITQLRATCNIASPAPEKTDFEELKVLIDSLNLPSNYQLREK